MIPVFSPTGIRQRAEGKRSPAFMAATTIIGVLAGVVLEQSHPQIPNGVNGWHGWQWLFLGKACRSSAGAWLFLAGSDKPGSAKMADPRRKGAM